MSMYGFATQDSRVSTRVRALEKGNLRLRRGSLIGSFAQVSTTQISSLLVQSKVSGKVKFSKTAAKNVGVVTA